MPSLRSVLLASSLAYGALAVPAGSPAIATPKLALPTPKVSVPAGIPVVSAPPIASLAISSALANAGGLPSVPSGPGVPSAPGVPTGLPGVPTIPDVPTGVLGSAIDAATAVGIPSGLPGDLPIPALNLNASQLVNKLSQALQLLLLVIKIAQELFKNGRVDIPGIGMVDNSVEGVLINTLLDVVRSLIPSPIATPKS